MGIFESKAYDKKADSSRRSFIWKVGAAMTTVLAGAVPGMAKPRTDNDRGFKISVDELSRQLGLLEDEKAICELHQTYEYLIDNGKYKEVVGLFTEDGGVIYNGGLFRGRKTGLSRLYQNHFSAGMTGRKIEPAPGFEPGPANIEKSITIASDRASAKARFPFSIQAGAPIASDSQLVKMARLHGGGIMKWWEGGIYEVSYVKDIKEGGWKIKRLEYRVLSKADYRPGRSYSRPIVTSAFSTVYPHDPVGPDRLVTQA